MSVLPIVLALFPTLALGSSWVQAQGELRLSVTQGWSDSRRQFAAGDAGGLIGPLCPEPVSAGDRMPYSCVTGGRFTVLDTHIDLNAGVLPWLTVDLTLPVVWTAVFADDVGRTAAHGIDDVRFGARAGWTRDRWALAGALHAKAPTGPRNFQDRDVAIGEGQWDLEAGARAGRSLWPYGWAESHQGFRVRLANGQTGIDPGEEWVGNVSVGLTPVQEAGIGLATEWVVAGPDRTGFGTRSPGRKLLLARAGLFARPVPPLWMEVGAAWPLAGQRWPVGPTWSASVAWTFDLSGR